MGLKDDMEQEYQYQGDNNNVQQRTKPRFILKLFFKAQKNLRYNPLDHTTSSDMKMVG